MGTTTIGMPEIDVQAISMSDWLLVPVFTYLIVKIVIWG